MIAIIIVLVLLGFIVYSIYPAISAPHTSDYMIEEDSPSYMENEEKPVTELVIEETSTNDDFVEKEVEFKAYFTDKFGKENIHHELSTFKKVDKKWYYVSGKFLD